LAKSLLEIPKILILDEPTRGVDVGAKFDVHTLIRELADSGVTVVLISSDLPEVLSLSDRIGVMRRGSMVGTLDGPQASQEQILALASGGDA
jgi:ABC-type sugar transport system ATPase subunit